MNRSIHTFLSDILDYAGLYPPASLSLADAFTKYRNHAESQESWMLSKFVAGTEYFSELGKLIDAEEKITKPFLISAVAPASNTLDEFNQVVDTTKHRIFDLVRNSDKVIQVPTLEIKLPKELFDQANHHGLYTAIEYAVDQMSETNELPHQIFFEIPGFAFDVKHSDFLAEALDQHHKKIARTDRYHYSFFGIKIRCGGLEAFQFPPTQYLAHAIHTSVKLKVPLKFTAGLHHPVRHYNNTVSTKMHGFLNVFGASLLAHYSGFNIHDIQAVLEDEDASHFIFKDIYFLWRDSYIPLEEIHMLRSLYVTSFGSCSFDEPIEDLQKLKLLT